MFDPNNPTHTLLLAMMLFLWGGLNYYIGKDEETDQKAIGLTSFCLFLYVVIILIFIFSFVEILIKTV